MHEPKDDIWMVEVGVNGWSALCCSEGEAIRKVISHLKYLKWLKQDRNYHVVTLSRNGKIVAQLGIARQ